MSGLESARDAEVARFGPGAKGQDEENMGIKINLHRTHRAMAGGREAVEVHGSTVGACLKDLVGSYPDLEDELFESSGTLKKNIEIWLNLETAYPDELSRPTRDGDEIHITVLLAGG